MNDLQSILLSHMYLAYKKAKADAFYDSSHLDVELFVQYEENLHRNLKRLREKIVSGTPFGQASEIGDFGYLPKSINPSSRPERQDIFFKCLDPIQEWNRRWSSENRAEVKFRLVIRATVEFQIFSALWIIRAGHLYDEVLDPDQSFGHRLRRRTETIDFEGDTFLIKPLNLDCIGLFEPYFSAYRDWRQRGLTAMRKSLNAGDQVFGVTMDIQNFYHRANANFLLSNKFLAKFDIQLSREQLALTQILIQGINTWYASTPDFVTRPQGGIPVGLSASKIIANVLLAELDEEFARKLNPVHYGRYVDDIFLVFKNHSSLDTGRKVMQHIASKLSPALEFESASELIPTDRLRLHLSYSDKAESDLIFAGEKQKVFNLSGKHGLDLISQIEHQIASQSSEHRLLSIIPSTSEEMAARTLIAHSEAALEGDALRKADVLSIKRLGLSLLLRDIESYSRDLRPNEWHEIRANFYSLVERHALSPEGYFSYSHILPRVLGVAIACGDYEDANNLLSRLCYVLNILTSTTSAGTIHSREFNGARKILKVALTQAMLQATTIPGYRWSKEIIKLINLLTEISGHRPLPRKLEKLKPISKRILYTDMGRRPYREYWLAGGTRQLPNPKVPQGIQIGRQLRLGAIRAFRISAKLRLPYWPALAFPTRPMSLSEITQAAPDLLKHPRELRATLFAMRGAKAKSHDGVLLRETSPTEPEVLEIDGKHKESINFAVPSFKTEDRDWSAALAGTPALSKARYERLRRLVNSVLQEPTAIDYIAFPECSIPQAWASTFGSKLASKKISMIAGLEYRHTRRGVHNEAFISIATDWPWHRSSVIYIQPKFAPAYEERRSLEKVHKRFAAAEGSLFPTIIQHEAFCFAVVICSDLTNISHRHSLQGRVDALVALEWNRDIETFSSLVETTANDLHAFIVQVNNRIYGDSRARAPMKENFKRDIVRVKGGEHDYFVTAHLSIKTLRDFQRTSPHSSAGPFKPVPVGFEMSEKRGRKMRTKRKA